VAGRLLWGGVARGAARHLRGHPASLADFVRRAWRPHDAVLGREDELKGYHDIDRHPTARRIPGLLLYRFDAPLFFANAGYFRRRVRRLVTEATHPVHWVVVAAEPITDVDGYLDATGTTWVDWEERPDPAGPVPTPDVPG
jgi:MFS superfamily sulfate permease-like transporter